MERILFSWVAKIKDFKKDDSGQKVVNPEGPTINFHQYHWNHDRHLIFYSSEIMAIAAERLKIFIDSSFPGRRVELVFVEISDILNLQEIKSNVERQVYPYRDDQLDFFFSPGAPMMQLSWYLIHQFSFLNSRLLQLKEARFSQNNKVELLEIELEKDDTASHALIRQISLDRPTDENFDTKFLLSESIKPVYKRAEKVAAADHVRVLIEGETGTGKEHLARHIHSSSGRREKTFLAVNCGALQDDLLLSTLFGHKKGAYTGADKERQGFFKTCHKGTLFLDEIGDISPRVQVALLRVLQEGEIMPLGSDTAEKVDTRIIAATNKSLVELCRKEIFRWDLYYRLAVVELRLPNVREREITEVSDLFEFFLEKYKRTFYRKKALKIERKAKLAIQTYPWPGNIREMINVIEQMYVFCEKEIRLKDLPVRIQHIPEELSEYWKEVEKRHLQKLMLKYDGILSRIKDAIGYGSINTLKKKLKEYNIPQSKSVKK